MDERKPLLMIDFQGFVDIPTTLGVNMDHIGVTPEGIRATVLEILIQAIAEFKEFAETEADGRVGGDAWSFVFSTIDNALLIASLLMRRLFYYAKQKHLYYLKPCMAINYGLPKFKDGQFMDDDSIAAFKNADKGTPFRITVLDDAYPIANSVSWAVFKDVLGGKDGKTRIHLFEWESSDNPNIEYPSIQDIDIPQLLLDNQAQYANSAKEALKSMMRLQSQSHNIVAFGGPAPISEQGFDDYVKEAIRLLKEEEKVFTVLSYLPIEEPVISYQWLELCYSISQRYPKNYAFAAFILQANSFKPFSYHIYDHKNIHMGLRAYSPHQDVPRISSSITLNNKMLAEKFYYEFIENFKSIGKMNEAIHAKLVLDLGVDSKIKSDTLNAIDKLLR